jgi:hypothetical protein
VDGLDGTGNLLATVDLPMTQAFCDPNHDYSCWDAAGVSFNGIAKSAVFRGVADQIGFSDITLGSSIPVPEPGAMLMLGTAVLGSLGTLRRRMKM